LAQIDAERVLVQMNTGAHRERARIGGRWDVDSTRIGGDAGAQVRRRGVGVEG